MGSSQDPDVDSMLQVSSALLTRHPTIAEAWMDKAVALLWIGRFDEALGAVDEALCIDPASGLAHMNRAYILGALKRPDDDVIASLRDALNREPALSQNLIGDESFAHLHGRPQFDALTATSKI